MANKLDGRMVSQLSARIRMQKKKRLEAAEKRQYGYWITDKGDVIPVPYESHHKVAEDYIKTHMNEQFLASIEDEDVRNSPYVYAKTYTYVLNNGWIRILNASYAFIAEVKHGKVARRAVHAYAKLAKEADAQGYTISVDNAGKSYYKEFTAQELSKANAMLLKEVNKTLTASYVDYGGWVTHEGKIIQVDHEGHERAAKGYIKSNNNDHYREYVKSGLALGEFLDYKTYALGELGWIRFRLDGKEMDVQCGLNAVNKVTLSAFNDYLEDKYFETYYLDVDLPVGVEEYPAGIKPAYRGIPNVKYLMGIMRKCLKRNDMTAFDYSSDDYGYWITHEGRVTKVEEQDHYSVADRYILKHWADEYVAWSIDQDLADATSFCIIKGWIRVINEFSALSLNFAENALSRAAVNSATKLIRDILDENTIKRQIEIELGDFDSDKHHTINYPTTKIGIGKAISLLRNNIKKTDMTANYGDDDFPCWITDKGVVDNEIVTHEITFKSYLRKDSELKAEYAKFLEETKDKDFTENEKVYKFACQQLGWIRVSGEPFVAGFTVASNSIAPLAYKAFHKYASQFNFSGDLMVSFVDSDKEKFAFRDKTYKTIQQLLLDFRSNVKKTNMTANNYGDDEGTFEAWLTDKGDIRYLGTQLTTHAKDFMKYLEKNKDVKPRYDEFVGNAIKGSDSYTQRVYRFATQELGWIRIAGEPSNASFMIAVGSVSPLAYKALSRFVGQFDFENDLVVDFVKTDTPKFTTKYVDYKNAKQLLNAVRTNVKKNPIIEAALNRLEAAVKMSLEEFIQSDLRNAYIKYKTLDSYYRKSQRVFEGKTYKKVLERANTSNKKRGDNMMINAKKKSTGLYRELDKLTEELARKYGYQGIYVESVLNDFLPEKLIEYGYKKVATNPAYDYGPPSFFKPLVEPATLEASLRSAWWIASDGKLIDVDVEHSVTASKYFPSKDRFKSLSDAHAAGWIRLMAYGGNFGDEDLAIQFDHDSINTKSINALTEFLKEMDFKVVTTSVSLPHEQEKYKRYEPFDKKDIGKIVTTLRENLRKGPNKTEVELDADNEVLNTESFSVIERWLPEDKYSKARFELLELPGNNFRVKYYDNEGQEDGSNDFRFFETARQGLRELIQLNRDQNLVFYKENIMRDNKHLEAASIDALPPEEFNVVERWEIPETLALEIREQNGKYSIARFSYAVIAKTWKETGRSVLGHSDLDRATQRLMEEVKIYESVAKKKMKKVKVASVAKPAPTKPVESSGTKVYSGDFIKGLRLEYVQTGRNIYATLIHEVSNKAVLKLDALPMDIETLANKLRTSELKKATWKVAAYKINTPEMRLLVNRVRLEILTAPGANEEPIPKENTCSIHALSLTTGKPMEYVWAIVKPYFKKGGINIVDLSRVLALLGYKLDIVHELSGTEKKKEKTWGFVQKALKDRKGSYLAYQLDHVIGIKDGLVKDTGNTGPRSPIMFVFEMTKIEAKHIAVTTRGEVKPVKPETKVTTVKKPSKNTDWLGPAPAKPTELGPLSDAIREFGDRKRADETAKRGVKKPEIDPAEFKHPLVGQYVFGKNNNDTIIKGILMRGTDSRGKTSGWVAILDEDGKPARAMLKGVKKMLTKPNKAMQNAYAVMRPKEGKGV